MSSTSSSYPEVSVQHVDRPRSEAAHAVSSRARYLVFPREHGAWGMLLVPLITGGVIGLRSGHGVASVAVLIVVSISLFCLRTPVEALLGTSVFRIRSRQEYGIVGLAIAGYAMVAASGLAFLMTRNNPGIFVALGVAAATGFLGQAAIRKLRPRDKCFAQLVGSAGLTATAAAGFYCAAGHWSATALLVWAANWLFAANQIHYVQLRIHAANAADRLEKLHRGLHFLFGEIVLTAVLVAAASVGALPWSACLAYLPLLARGVAWFWKTPAPLAVRRLGYSEMLHAVAFGMLLIACL